MATKTKPKTGAAVSDDTNDDQDTGPGSVGFIATPSVPGPGGPLFSMGGDLTRPSDFDSKVAAATNVPSKGGPAVEDLYASSGKGPVGKLSKPSETKSTTKAPEDKTAPKPPEEIGPGSVGFHPLMPAVTPTPAVAATPAPAATAAAPAPADTTPTPAGTPVEGSPESLPAFQDHRDMIEKYAKQYQSGVQDYTRLDPYTTHDPNFAGTIEGEPFFMDNKDHRSYYRDETSPGQGVRHYFDSPAGSKEATDGVPYSDGGAKAQISKDAQVRMQALLQTQDAINSWRSQFKDFMAKNPGGEAWFQRPQLQALMGGGTDLASNALRTIADVTQGWGGITPEMKKLDAARAQMALSYTQAASKNLPTTEAIRTATEVPLTSEDLDTQKIKVDAMQQAIDREARTLQVLYPYGNREMEAILKKIGEGQGKTQQGSSQSPPAGSTVRPAATPSATPSVTPSAPVNLDQDHDHSIWNSLPSGTKVIYNGKPYTKP